VQAGRSLDLGRCDMHCVGGNDQEVCAAALQALRGIDHQGSRFVPPVSALQRLDVRKIK
jgi:hypothetical protein